MDASLIGVVVTAISAVAGLGLVLIFVRMLRSPKLPSGVEAAAALKFAEGERDRLQTVAKGVAAASSGFLVALLTALVEGTVADQLPPAAMTLLVLGSIGMLLLAAAQSRATARCMAEAVMAGSTSAPVAPAPTNRSETFIW